MKKIRIKLGCALLALLTLLSCVSCDISKKISGSGKTDKAYISAMAEFSFALFKGLLTKDGENDLVSPLSAAICLAMIANGAEGETKAQMEKAFGMDIDTLNRNLCAYVEAHPSTDDCKVSIADSVWIQESFPLKESFLQTNADRYNAQIYTAPFDDSTVKDINNWCKKHTDGMIQEILQEIPINTVMYLINALAFDAIWENGYTEDAVRKKVFGNYDGTESEVEMMYSNTDDKSYLIGEGAEGFVKNYAGGKYGFVGLLPEKGTDIYEFADSLDGEKWLSLWESRKASKKWISGVCAGIPEFSYSVKTKLNDTLKTIGMTDMFDVKTADFSGMSDEPLYCSEVGQKVFIDVNRDGTKAAAVTWGAENYLGSGSTPQLQYVVLDRPFVYMIVDCETGLPLFVGVVSQLG